MVLYFTGTGNSAYVAKRIAKETGQETLDLFQKIQENDCTKLQADEPWIMVFPTYAWRMPRILEQWLKKTALCGNTRIYFVMTCGGNIGNAGQYLKALCSEKGMQYAGCFEVVMPENYTAMFTTPSEAEALKTIEKAEGKINEAISFIQANLNFPAVQISFADKVSSGIVNDLFYPLFVHAKKFHATDDCIGCGVCEKVCPLKNIKLENGKPRWADRCTHCMACINRCPKEAIEYGRHSVGLPRYVCPKK